MAGPQSDLVVISATGKDILWWNGLRARSPFRIEGLEWWTQSRLIPSENWDDQLKDALKRASLAMVLLSPAYLETPQTGEYELNLLGEFAERNGLTLFPILLEECEWRRYPFLHRVQVWGSDKPLRHLSDDALIVEYGRILQTIQQLGSSSPESETETSEDFRVSVSADRVMSAAESLASQTGRGRITASCLLFALVDSGKFFTPPSTSHFLRKQLNKAGLYDREYNAFLKDGGPSAHESVSISGTSWKMSRNAGNIFTRAADIAASVNGNDSNEVHARHLFGALITPLVVGSRSVRERLARMAVDESELCAEFRKFIASVAQNELPSEWDRVLGTGPASQPKTSAGTATTPATVEPPPVLPVNELDYRSGYSIFIADRAPYREKPNDPLDDSLNVRTYAFHLAQVIAAKDTPMPLSIGLFGAWGAGKSHFIDLLDEQLNDLNKHPGNTFHKRIVPIHFNAWHYLDTNLWANLVSEIFDGLFKFLESPEEKEKEKLENLKKRLADQSALAAEANAAVEKAENVRKQAEQELRTAVLERINQEGTVNRLLDDLSQLKISKEVQKQLNDVAKALGLPKLRHSFKELEARADEVRSLTGRIKALGLALFTGPGWWVRAVLFIVALLTPLAVSWLATHGTPWVKELLAGTGRSIAQVVTAIAALSTWLATQVKAGNSIVTKLESAYDQVAKVRRDAEAEDDAATAQAALAQKRQTEEEARHKLHEAEEKLKTIKTELAELAPGRQLMRFLRERATAEDYRRHLGLVSLVRQDFKQLSDLMTKGATKPDAKPTNGASPDAVATPNGGSSAATAASPPPPPELPIIDRIILYIDDLDRCRSDRVIEVLEAVHLLLAFPLFTVVVAVDPRWLRQSLLDHYPRLLGGAEAENANGRARSLGRPATPQDYLEKIFQVPFNLQPMEKSGYELLVDHLFTPKGSKSKVPPPPADPPPPKTGEQLTATAATETPTTGEKIQSPPSQIPSGSQPQQPAPEKQTPPQPPPDPKRLVLTGKEIADVKKFQLLFQTPRAVKRLANTYSLIRVGVDESEWSKYMGTESAVAGYRVPMLLLAVTSAFPALARPWLLWLRDTPPAQWPIGDSDLAQLIENNTDTTASEDWKKLQKCLQAIGLDGWPPPDREMLEHWVPRVARYSF